MRVGYNWLKDYVDFDLSPSELADLLTMSGLEVEELVDRYDYLSNVVTARVAEVWDHPQSDHLKVCKVEDGGASFQVICGAPNVKAGMITAFARVGTELPGGQTVGEVEIRGEKSSGMLCSEAELVTGPDASGIIAFDDSTAPGQGVKQVLGLSDHTLEIGVTPNRPDCLCIMGVAREVAGLTGKKLKYPEMPITEGSTPITDLTSVEILAPEHCPRYVARVIKGVSIGPSPFWMVDRLAAVGIRAISNIVDITNYVLMEVGQPLHAFDLNELEEHRIVVKLADEGDRFTTLDGTERIMGPEMLMICDGKKAVGLAGIMGGLNSEITDKTTDVLLESAHFNAVSSRRTSKTLGLSTEASYRFERGVDPVNCLNAANRAISLMAELAGGTVAAGVIDVNPIKHKTVTLPFNPGKCNAFLGTSFSDQDIVSKLSGIELGVTSDKEPWEVTVPGFRVDLEREIDLYEEVARLAGFDKVPTTMPAVRAKAIPLDPTWYLRNRIRDVLEGLGLSEAINYSFISMDFCDRLELSESDPLRNTVPILNPLTEDQALMRTSLVPGLLDSLRRNQSHNEWDVALYEIGMIFLGRKDAELPEERLTAAGLISGNRDDLNWHNKPRPVDFYDLKGVVEELLESVGVSNVQFSTDSLPAYYDGNAAARVSSGEKTLGHLGRIKPTVGKAFGVRDETFSFELDLVNLAEVREATPQFQSLSRFPAVERDLALVLDTSVPAGSVADYINSLGQEYLTGVRLFDKYEGDQVGDGRKSLAFRLQYRSQDRTLTDDEVNAYHQTVTDKVLNEFKAGLRA
jgi:phenylalanyl-tRNA synthetase beta chain